MLNTSIPNYISFVRADADRKIFTCVFPDLPGVFARSTSHCEATKLALGVLRNRIACMQDCGLPLPEPGTNRRASVAQRVHVRRSLHESLLAAAERRDSTLRQVVIQMLFRHFSSKDTTLEEVEAAYGRVRKRRTVREEKGKWSQRFPRSLYVHLEALAYDEKVSVNLLINTILAVEVSR